MALNTNNETDKRQQHDGVSDRVLEKLEEMWDKKILKGDDDFFEGANGPGIDFNSSDKAERRKPKRTQRRRIN